MTHGLHLDTHVIVWLYAGRHDLFPTTLVERLETDVLAHGPMVRLELAYLHELGRLETPPHRILAELANALSLTEDPAPFGDVIDITEGVRFTRDPFDRLIVAQAIAARSVLVTRDASIRDAYPHDTMWG